MAVNVTMPKWGLTMKEGKVSRWLKAEGDAIRKGEPLLEVETEKITNVVEATAGGVLFQIVGPAGTVVPVGTVVAVIAEPGEQPARVEGLRMGEISEGPAPAGTRAAAPKPEAPTEKKFIPASPAARRPDRPPASR